MPAATYQYIADFAGTQFQADLISRGLAAADEPANYDLTPYVLDTTIRRGRQTEFQPFGAGVMTLLVANADWRFTPEYGASPYYPMLRVGTMIQARAVAPDYTNLVSWWTLDEQTGSTRYDSFGTNHLTQNDGVQQVAGIIDFAAAFNQNAAQLPESDWLARGLAAAETQHYLYVASNSTIQPGAFSFSACAWVYFTAFPSTASVGIVTKITNISPFTAGNLQWGMYYWAANGSLRFSISPDGNSYQTVASPAVISLNTWYFVVVIYDYQNSQFSVSVNGETLNTNPQTLGHGVFATGTARLMIGSYDDLTSLLRGYVDNVAYFQRALTQADVTALYNSGNGVGFYANASGGYAPLFTGFISRITPQLDDAQQTATIEAADLIDRMTLINVFSRGIYQSKTTDELIRRLLSDGIAWRSDRTAITSGQDTVSYAWWMNEPLATALQGVERSEWGEFFIDGRGYPTFNGRNARGAAATSVGVVLGDTDIQSASLVQDIADVFNDVRVQAHPRVTGGTAVQIWALRQTITLLAGASQVIVAQYSDPLTQQAAPALNVITPVATTDYSANSAATGGTVTSVTGSGGSGYDLNRPPRVFFSGGGGNGAEAVAQVAANGTVSAISLVSGGGGYTSAPTVSLEAYAAGVTAPALTAVINVGTDQTASLTVATNFQEYGQQAIITITNTSAGTIFVPYLRLRGDPLIEPSTSPAIATDGASQANYLKRTLLIDQRWQQSTVNAASLASIILGRYATPRSRVKIGLANLTQSQLSDILNAELDQMYTISLGRAGIASANFFAGYLEHHISDYGYIHSLTLLLERSRVDGGGVYDSAIFDTTKYS